MSKRPSQQPCSGIGRSDGLSYRKYSLKFHLIISIYNLVRAELRRLWLAVRGGRLREQGAAPPRRAGVQRPGWMSVGVCLYVWVCVLFERECLFTCVFDVILKRLKNEIFWALKRDCMKILQTLIICFYGIMIKDLNSFFPSFVSLSYFTVRIMIFKSDSVQILS